MGFGIPAGRTFTLLFVTLLGIWIAASYANSFGIGFYFDDTYGIANNPAIRSLRNIPLFFTDPYRPYFDLPALEIAFAHQPP